MVNIIYVCIYIPIWLVVDLPLRKMMDFVSWDDYSIPNIWNNKSHVPNHQPDIWFLYVVIRYIHSQMVDNGLIISILRDLYINSIVDLSSSLCGYVYQAG